MSYNPITFLGGGGTKLFDLKKQREFALNRVDSVLRTAKSADRDLTESESQEIDTLQTAVDGLSRKIHAIESKNTVKVNNSGALVIEGGRQFAIQPQKMLSHDYAEDFFSYISSAGQKIGAALYEGSDAAGGYAVPIIVDSQIVPLAPPDMGVRKLATVVPTVSDVKIPQKGSFGASTAKAENAAFTETDPTLSQITLSAFMSGNVQTASWELLQDVPLFQQFIIDDLLTGQQVYEEGRYVSGTGTGQPQGLIGNVGAGVTEEPDANGNLVSIAGLLDLIGTLKTVYHANAAFLMQRSTSTIIRKAQVQSNLFEPVWTRVGGQDYLFGYPVEYSASMPVAARGAAPILFGDFKRGYVIGDRGGSGINVKVLDQPLATQGQIQLLAYRRSDGRVRRSEAIQQYNVAAS